MSSPRAQRLQTDYERVSSRFAGWPSVLIELTEGLPPDLYRIWYKIKGLYAAPDGRILERDEHILEIKLGLEYPRCAPQLRMLTPIFHPNFNQTEVCTQDIYVASEGLDDLIIRIGRMIAYQEYNTKSPLNGFAAKWAAENSSRLPVDRREIAPPAPEVRSNTRPPPIPIHKAAPQVDDRSSEIVITEEEFSSTSPDAVPKRIEIECPQSSNDAITEQSSDKSPMDDQDSELYAKAVSEIASKTFNLELFAKAFAESDGDEDKAKSIYIRYRFNELRRQRKETEEAAAKVQAAAAAAAEKSKDEIRPPVRAQEPVVKRCKAKGIQSWLFWKLILATAALVTVMVLVVTNNERWAAARRQAEFNFRHEQARQERFRKEEQARPQVEINQRNEQARLQEEINQRKEQERLEQVRKVEQARLQVEINQRKEQERLEQIRKVEQDRLAEEKRLAEIRQREEQAREPQAMIVGAANKTHIDDANINNSILSVFNKLFNAPNNETILLELGKCLNKVSNKDDLNIYMPIYYYGLLAHGNIVEANRAINYYKRVNPSGDVFANLRTADISDKCQTCDGSGSHVTMCAHCTGTGKVSVSDRYGNTHEETCNICQGAGKLTIGSLHTTLVCNKCSGKGYIINRDKCREIYLRRLHDFKNQ